MQLGLGIQMRIFLRWSGEQQNFAFESSGSQAQTPKNTIVLRQNYLELISRLTAVVGAISEWDAHLRDSHLIPIWDFYLRFLFEILIWEHPWTPLSSSDWRSLMRCFENCALFNLDSLQFTWSWTASETSNSPSKGGSDLRLKAIKIP